MDARRHTARDDGHLQAHTKRFFLTRGYKGGRLSDTAAAMQRRGGGLQEGRQAQVAVLVNFDVDDYSRASPFVWSQLEGIVH